MYGTGDKPNNKLPKLIRRANYIKSTRITPKVLTSQPLTSPMKEKNSWLQQKQDFYFHKKTNQLPKIKTGTNRTFQIAKTAHSAKNNCAACLCFIFIFDEIWVPGSWFQQSQLEADRSKRFPFQWWQFSKFGLTTLERDLRRCLLLNIQSSLESTW